MTESQWVISVTKFSANPSRALEAAQEQPVLITKHQRPHAYLVSAECWVEMRTLLANDRAEKAEKVNGDSAIKQVSISGTSCGNE